MEEQQIDTVLLSVGHDLPYLSGYTAMPLERLTMLVVPRDSDATMVIPALGFPCFSLGAAWWLFAHRDRRQEF